MIQQVKELYHKDVISIWNGVVQDIISDPHFFEEIPQTVHTIESLDYQEILGLLCIFRINCFNNPSSC